MKNIEMFLNEVRDNEAFRAAIRGVNSAEEIKEISKGYGIEITVDELKMIKCYIAESSEGYKLSDEELEFVGGGESKFSLGARAFLTGFFKPVSSTITLIKGDEPKILEWGDIGDSIVHLII